jgi:hypothetical protein
MKVMIERVTIAREESSLSLHPVCGRFAVSVWSWRESEKLVGRGATTNVSTHPPLLTMCRHSHPSSARFAYLAS